jgi:hypothetical protein
VDHEYEPEAGWKQLGPLANSVLRSVMEKRKAQAEMMRAAPAGPKSALPPAQRDTHAQLDLQLFPPAIHLAQARSRQGAHRL